VSILSPSMTAMELGATIPFTLTSPNERRGARDCPTAVEKTNSSKAGTASVRNMFDHAACVSVAQWTHDHRGRQLVHRLSEQLVFPIPYAWGCRPSSVGREIFRERFL